jgi:hypothetical protein
MNSGKQLTDHDLEVGDFVEATNGAEIHRRESPFDRRCACLLSCEQTMDTIVP